MITRGKKNAAIKAVIYGVEGIGKTTFASNFPGAVFIDTEGSTTHMDVARLPDPSSWEMLKNNVKYAIQHPNEVGSLIIDTADWAEKLCSKHVCDRYKVDGIESFGYGKGYTYLAEEFGSLLNLLEDVKNAGINAVLVAHAKVKKREQPDEIGSYDRWELKCTDNVSSMIKEWADLMLFAKYKTMVINVDDKGAQKGKNKAQGNKRVMYTEHHPCWDAKNRFNLEEELPFDFNAIAHIFTKTPSPNGLETPASPVSFNPDISPAATESTLSGIPKALSDLMQQSGVTESEIRLAVSQQGFFPMDMPVSKYAKEFTEGFLVANWDKVVNSITQNRAAINNTPIIQ